MENKRILPFGFLVWSDLRWPAYKTIEKYGNKNGVVNNPVKEEHEDNQRFLHDVEKWL